MKIIYIFFILNLIFNSYAYDIEYLGTDIEKDFMFYNLKTNTIKITANHFYPIVIEIKCQNENQFIKSSEMIEKFNSVTQKSKQSSTCMYEKIKYLKYISTNCIYIINIDIEVDTEINFTIIPASIVSFKLNNLEQIYAKFIFYDINNKKIETSGTILSELKIDNKTHINFIVESMVYTIKYYFDKNNNYIIDNNENLILFEYNNEQIINIEKNKIYEFNLK